MLRVGIVADLAYQSCKMIRSVVVGADAFRMDGLEEQMRIMREESWRNMEKLLEEVKQK